MKTFTYNGELYIRVIPAKTLCRSSLIYEVITRGDIFAIRAKDSVLTIIPGTAQVIHHEHKLTSIDTEQTSIANSKVQRKGRSRRSKRQPEDNRQEQLPFSGNL